MPSWGKFRVISRVSWYESDRSELRLGIAYVGSHREDLLTLLLPHLQDDSLSMEIISLTALSLGFIFVGSCNGDVAGVILEKMMEKEEAQLNEKWARLLALGLALLYVGKSYLTH
jgi:26S proteasome regulatory subunit N1